jgi:hypothetical protein
VFRGINLEDIPSKYRDFSSNGVFENDWLT